MRAFLPILLLLFCLLGCASQPAVRQVASVSCFPSAAGSRPRPSEPAGAADPAIPIEHIVVLMQENHSFDTYFGRLNQPEFYGRELDGISTKMFSYDSNSQPVRPYHSKTLCVQDVDHLQQTMAEVANGEGNRKFARLMGPRSMGFFDQRDIPYYYNLASHFAVADRYFSSMLGPTYPNRFFLWTATAFGHTDNRDPHGPDEFRQKTIFDLLNDYGISWKYYTEYQGDFHGGPGYLSLFGTLKKKSMGNVGKIADFAADAASGNLASVIFVDADEKSDEDEHPNSNIQVGQAWVASRVRTVMESKLWPKSVLFLAYDEGGGFYDHVSPPAACAPDDMSPQYFKRYGFRVPFVAISPFAKHHYVSHRVYDHTSILKFIETKFNLPALTNRDGRADGLLDLFDFSHPNFEVLAPGNAVVRPENGRCL